LGLCRPPPLVHLDVGGLDHRPPFRDLGLLPGAAIAGVSLKIRYSHDCAALRRELLGSIRFILRAFVALK
jgi:hypothetical protein